MRHHHGDRIRWWHPGPASGLQLRFHLSIAVSCSQESGHRAMWDATALCRRRMGRRHTKLASKHDQKIPDAIELKIEMKEYVKLGEAFWAFCGARVIPKSLAGDRQSVFSKVFSRVFVLFSTTCFPSPPAEHRPSCVLLCADCYQSCEVAQCSPKRTGAI